MRKAGMFSVTKFACLTIIAMIVCVCNATDLEPGHTAMWFNPDRNGEGLVVEVLSSDRILLYWFTYDDEGNQRWLQGVGLLSEDEEDSQSIEILEFYLTRGPTFGATFDPEDLEILPVGSASLSFQGCESAIFSYDVNGQVGQIPVVRLSRTMGSTCRPLHGVPGEPTKFYAGESGTWFDPDSNGQGFALQWLTQDEALITWYTYDSQGNQYWMVGNGARDGDDIYFETLHSTKGARFGDEFDPDDVELIDWGSLRLSLSCGSGTADFHSELEEFGSGSLQLTRLTAIDGLPCPWVPPALNDIYNVDIEVVVDSFQLPGRDIEVVDFASDGTVLGVDFQDDSVWLRPSGELEFQKLENESRLLTPLLASNGATIYAEQLDRNTGQSRFVKWTVDTGWSLVEGVLAENPRFVTRSHSRETIIGFDSQALSQDEFLWAWNESDGFAFIIPTNEGNLLIPLGVSDSGDRYAAVQQSESPVQPSPATFWVSGDSTIEILSSESSEKISSNYLVCDGDCRTVFGVPADISGEAGELWYSIEGAPAQFQKQELVADTEFLGPSLTAISGDGTMVAGAFLPVPAPTENSDAFIWSQDLGFIRISDLLVAEGFEMGFSNIIQVRAISQDGLQFLVWVSSTTSASSSSFSKGVLVNLSIF